MACGRVGTVPFEWVQISLASHDPRLAAALSDIMAAAKKGPTPRLYTARYRYGELIVDRGTFTPPCSSVACADCRALKENCTYGHIPLAVILSNGVEVFVEHEISGQQGRTESAD